MTYDIASSEYPRLHMGFTQWVTWTTIEGRKQPFSPWSDAENQYGWSNPENWAEYNTARKWADMHPRLTGVGFILQREGDPYQEPADPTVLIDFDDVRDPETGAVHPYAKHVIARAGTYADVSTSGTGVHLLGVGELPDGVTTIQDELPEHEDFPGAEIEVYDGKRFSAMTGKWIKESNRDVTDVDYWLRRLSRRFDTTDKAPSTDTDVDNLELDNTEFDDKETTDSMDEVTNAIESVGRRDIRLRSTVSNERADGVVDYDPAYRTSESGTGLAWLNRNEVWIDRNGEYYLDALHLVALEEGIVSRPSNYPSGDDFWRAVEALRERGASIPRYEGYNGTHPDALGLYGDTNDEEEQRRKAVLAMRASQGGT